MGGGRREFLRVGGRWEGAGHFPKGRSTLRTARRRAAFGARGRDSADRRPLVVGGPPVATETAGSEPAVAGLSGSDSGTGSETNGGPKPAV